LVEAAVRLILRQGYAGTTVDQVCAEAGVTKGAFFHYFASKEEIGRAAMDAWSAYWADILDASGLDDIPDPLERLDRLFDVMSEAYLSPDIGPGCVVGTVGQETGASNPALGGPSRAHLDAWAAHVRSLLAEAKSAHPPTTDFDPAAVADFLLGVVQGTLLVAKTRQEPVAVRAVIEGNVTQARAYVLGLFGRAAT
jgi:TetR/AcrR family transcriptional repressor of nem operon